MVLFNRSSLSYHQFSMSAPAKMFNTSVIRTVIILLSTSRIIFSIPVTDDYSVELLSTSVITYTSPAPEDFTTEKQNASECETAATSNNWVECVAFLETHLSKDSKEYSQLHDLKNSFRLSIQSHLPLIAAIRGYTELIHVLLRNGVPFNKKYSLEDTVLHAAAKNGHKDLTVFLLIQGADIQVKNWIGNTPLHEAARRFQSTTVRLLLDAGADVNIVNNLKQTALFHTVDNLNLPEYTYSALNSREVAEIENSRYVIGKDIIQLLLEHGADTNIANNARRTPLHVAAKNGILTIVQVLIEGGANINATDIYKQTPLHKATEGNIMSVVKYLVTMGCDKTITDTLNRTALDIAKEKNFTKIINLLSSDS